MAWPPIVHRIITGHSSNGKAVIESDTKLMLLNPITNAPAYFESKLGSPAPVFFSLIHRTCSFPASNNEPPIEYHVKRIRLEDETGTTCRIVGFPPMKLGDDGKLPDGFVLRIQSLDFGVVLKGKIVLELDDEVETEAEEGAVVVQRYSCPGS